MTLLEMVQSILLAMKATPVNSLGDTEQSRSVVNIVKEVYYEEMSYGDWPHLRVVTKLESVSDPSRPTTLKIPDDLAWVDAVRYDIAAPGEDMEFHTLTHLPQVEEFLEIMDSRRSTASNVDVVETSEAVPLLVLNDRHPEYWTSFDNKTIIVDSYRKDLSTTLVADKTSCIGKRLPAFQMVEDFAPDIPRHKFPQLLAACKERAFEYLKQTSSPGDISANRRLRTRDRYIGGRTHVQFKPRTFGHR